MRVQPLIGVILFAVFGIAGCVSPSSTVIVGTPRPAITVEQVKLYLRPPKKFEEIAVIESSSLYSTAVTQQGKMDAVINNLKLEAAKIGANGVLLQSTGDQSAGALTTGSGTATRVGNTAFGSGLAISFPMMHKAGGGIAIYVVEE